MGNYVSEQLLLFLQSVVLGGVLGLVYDLLRALRKLGGRGWGGLLDALYCLGTLCAVAFFVMAGDGELRLFVLAGIVGGAVLFFCLLSQPLRPLWDFWLTILLTPVRLVKKFLKTCQKIWKKLFSFFRNWFTIIGTRLRRAQPAEEGDETMAKTAKQGGGAAPEKQERKRPSSKLTGILLLVLILGIGVQVYNLQGQLEEARATEAVYAARRDALAETNAQLAEDIANSDDPELIREIAREDLGMVSPGEKVFIIGN